MSRYSGDMDTSCRHYRSFLGVTGLIAAGFEVIEVCALFILRDLPFLTQANHDFGNITVNLQNLLLEIWAGKCSITLQDSSKLCKSFETEKE